MSTRLLPFVTAFALAAAAHADLLITDQSLGTVQRYDENTGAYLGDIVSGLISPEGIAVGPDGKVYVAEAGSASVKRFLSDGTPDGVFASGLGAPFGIAFDPSGDLLVGAYATYLNPTGDLWGRLYRLNAGGQLVNDSLFYLPQEQGIEIGLGAFQIAIGPSGDVFAGTTGTNLIHISADATSSEAAYTEQAGPYGVAFDSAGAMYFSEKFGGKVYKVATPGGTPTVFAEGLAGPESLCFDHAGNLLVNTRANFSITRIRPDGTSDVGFGLSAPFNPLLVSPRFMALTRSYKATALYDEGRAVRQGACYPIKVRIEDASGANVSSSTFRLHAVSVALASTNATGTLMTTGNANPDFDFRYDASLGGYVLNLDTSPLHTGTWSLVFLAGTDSTTYTVKFEVK